MEEYGPAYDCEIRRRQHVMLMDGPWSCVPDKFTAVAAAAECDGNCDDCQCEEGD